MSAFTEVPCPACKAPRARAGCRACLRGRLQGRIPDRQWLARTRQGGEDDMSDLIDRITTNTRGDAA